MSSSKTAPDKVDKATADVRRAIGRLIGLLGDEDLAVVEKAVERLVEIGPFAVTPLAAALPRATTQCQAMRIIVMLQAIGQHYPGPIQAAVGRALTAAIRNSRCPELRAFAAEAMSRLIMPEFGPNPLSNASNSGKPFTS